MESWPAIYTFYFILIFGNAEMVGAAPTCVKVIRLRPHWPAGARAATILVALSTNIVATQNIICCHTKHIVLFGENGIN